MLILFLDESGEESLDPIDPQYPVLGIGGAIFDEQEYIQTEDEKVKLFKRSVFGTDSIILRGYDIAKKHKDFTCLNDPALWNRFHQEYSALTQNLNYIFISRVIHKLQHKSRYSNPFPPYEWVFELIVESYCRILYRKNERGKIIIEARDKGQNRKVEQSFKNVMTKGTNYISASQFQKRILDFGFGLKRDNISGLQISDVSIYTATVSCFKKAYRRRDYLQLKTKFDPNHGLKEFP